MKEKTKLQMLFSLVSHFEYEITFLSYNNE